MRSLEQNFAIRKSDDALKTVRNPEHLIVTVTSLQSEVVELQTDVTKVFIQLKCESKGLDDLRACKCLCHLKRMKVTEFSSHLSGGRHQKSPISRIGATACGPHAQWGRQSCSKRQRGDKNNLPGVIYRI